VTRARVLCLFLIAAALAGPTAGSVDYTVRRITLPLVGRAPAYVPTDPTSHVVLLTSGQAGWTPALDQIARHLAGEKILVIGLSFPALQRSVARGSGCWYAASDFELLSHEAQRLLALPRYSPPVLVGAQAGAAAVYAALAPAPMSTFAGAVSLAFEPTLPVARDVCLGDVWLPSYSATRHVNTLPPSPKLPKAWYVLQGTRDRVMSTTRLAAFTHDMPQAHVVDVDDVARSISPPTPWLAPLDTALDRLWAAAEQKTTTAPPPPAIGALEASLNKLGLDFEFRLPPDPRAFVVFWSGDGGWASIDQGVSERLMQHGIGVVGLSSLRYFWQKKTSEQVGADLKNILDVLKPTGRPLFAGGYSFGAETIPVVLSHMPASLRQMLDGLVLIGPGLSASFEIDPLDWIREPSTDPQTLVAPAIRADGLPAICLAGAGEEDSGCAAADQTPHVEVVRLPGGHHFDDDYDALAHAIERFIGARTHAPSRPASVR
jgi:type IV secretory pathway VirJ component